jgi:hypothetical protein
MRGNEEIVKLLLRMDNININAVDERYGDTPIMTAVNITQSKRDYSIVWLLLHLPKIDLSHRNDRNLDLVYKLLSINNTHTVS